MLVYVYNITLCRYLEPYLLKYHVDNAILLQGRARKDSEKDAKKREEQIGSFVQSFKKAQKVHDIRLELEAKGHPDHQLKQPYDLGRSIDLRALEQEQGALETALHVWTENLKRVTTEIPSLLLLRDKLLLSAIQIVRCVNPDLLQLMPYVILCLGDQMLHFRANVYHAAGSCLRTLLGSRNLLANRSQNCYVCSAEEGLNQFAQLIGNIQDALAEEGLAVFHDVGDADEPKVFIHKMFSHDTVCAPIEKTYEAVMSEYMQSATTDPQTSASPLSTQIVWGNKNTSISEVKAWLHLARAPVNGDQQCIVHSLYFVAVDQLSIPCRQVLLEGVLCQSEVWQVRLSVPVFLYFSSHKGLESFIQFQDVPSRALDAKLFMKTLWSFKKPNVDANIPPPISKLFVVAGDSGSGKSHWCLAKGTHSKIQPQCWLHIVVHEGFSVQLLINHYRSVTSQGQPDRIGFHFDVSEYSDLELFGVVLHDFFSSGLMVDSITGDAQVLLHGIEHLVFVELPALDHDTSNSARQSKWPGDTAQFRASQHPFLTRLPALKFAVSGEVCFKTLSNTESAYHTAFPLFNDSKTSYVAQLLELIASQSLDVQFPLFQDQPFENIDPDAPPSPVRNRANRVILDAFAGFGGQSDRPVSKRIICNFVSLLFERCVYLSQMQAYTSDVEPVRQFLFNNDDTALMEPELAHFWVYPADRLTQLASVPPAVAAVPPAVAAGQVAPAPRFRLARSPIPPNCYIPNFYAKILQYCVNESAFLAGAHLPHNEPQVWILRCNNFNKLRLLVSLPKKGMTPQIYQPEMQKVKLQEFMGKQGIVIEMFSTAGKLDPRQREDIAPFFGLKNSSRFKDVVDRTEYVLTTEFLLKLFLLQGRRSCRSSLIFSGDTGVGKSMMLNLYSQFVNADSTISIDWHTQFLAIARGLALVCVDDPFVRGRFFRSVGGRDPQYLGELYETERQRVLALPEEAAAEPQQQFSQEVRAAAFAKLKIADVKKTPALLYSFIDPGGRNAVSFEACAAAVDSVFRSFIEDGSEKCTEQTLQLFGDTISFYFDCLVESIPLIKRGLSQFCSVMFERTKSTLQDGVRRRNAERVCKIARSLPSFDSGNTNVSQGYVLKMEDFCIESADDVHVHDAPFDLFPGPNVVAAAFGGDSDEVPSSGGGGDANHDFENKNGPIFKKSTDFREFINALVQTRPFGLYHRILAHDALDCVEWRSRINAIKKDARDATEAFPNAVVCVFVDEMNTANALGLISEAFSNHSMDGEPLPPSLFFVGAINPYIQPDDAPVHQEHLGINDDDEYAMREFIVRPLPPCLSQMLHEWVKFDSVMERNFLEVYIQKRNLSVFLTKVLNWDNFVRDGPLNCRNALNQAYSHASGDFQGDYWHNISTQFHSTAVALIVKCQEITNQYSRDKLLLRVRPSIRDILRCVNIWHWILAQQVPSECDAQLAPKMDSIVNPYLPVDSWTFDIQPDLSFDSIELFVKRRVTQALYAAIALCYFIRLPASAKDPRNPNATIQLRRDFLDKLKGELRITPAQPINFVQNWKECVDHLWLYAEKPLGIAHTDVLKENFYAVVVALHVKPTMPLLITGPAGKAHDVDEMPTSFLLIYFD